MNKKAPKRGKPLQIKFYVSEDEKQKIDEKFIASQLKSRRSFFLKAILGIPIYIFEQKPIREHTQELNKIGVNFNQMVKRLNSAPDVNPKDIEQIKAYMEAVYKSENEFLKKFIKLR